VAAIQSGKIAHVMDLHNYFVSATDATYEGFYTYPPDSISPSCGQVVLEMFSEKTPESAATKVLDEKTVQQGLGRFRAVPKGDLSTHAQALKLE
jgi:hypothetical protein